MASHPRTRALLAALLLLVQALFPGFHDLQHRHEVAADGSFYCAVHQVVHRAPVDRTGASLEAEDTEVPHHCAVCFQLQQLRDLMAPGPAALAATAAPPVEVLVSCCRALGGQRGELLPPVRGPPVG